MFFEHFPVVRGTHISACFKNLFPEAEVVTYFIHSSFRQMRHWSTTSTKRFWFVKAASILFKMVGPTVSQKGLGWGEKVFNVLMKG